MSRGTGPCAATAGTATSGGWGGGPPRPAPRPARAAAPRAQSALSRRVALCVYFNRLLNHDPTRLHYHARCRSKQQ